MDRTNAERQARWQTRRKEELTALRTRVKELEAENAALKRQLANSKAEASLYNGLTEVASRRPEDAYERARTQADAAQNAPRGQRGAKQREAREALRQARREMGERMRRDLDEGLRQRLWERQYGATYRRKLARVLGMLGSDHKGERDAAAQQAETIRRRLKTSWDQLIPNQPALSSALGRDILAAEQMRRGLGLTWEQLLRGATEAARSEPRRRPSAR